MPTTNDLRRAYRLRRWTMLARAIKDRDGWRCTMCGRAARLEVHHVVSPLHGGGMWDEDNLRTLCLTCHLELHRKQLEDLLEPDAKARLEYIHRVT